MLELWLLEPIVAFSVLLQGRSNRYDKYDMSLTTFTGQIKKSLYKWLPILHPSPAEFFSFPAM